MIGVIPETAEEALKNWDKGEMVFTVEMGGLGPGYEQAIHLTLFETLRLVLQTDKTIREMTKLPDVIEAAITQVCKKHGDTIGGITGAQAGVVKWLLTRYVNEGWGLTVRRFPQDRRIQVSNFFPHIELSR